MPASPEDAGRDRMSMIGDGDDVASCFQASITKSPLREVLGKQLCSVFDSALGQPSVRKPTEEPVQVFLRLRPLSEGSSSAIEVKPDGKSVRATAPTPLNERKEFREPRDYSFTRVMDGKTTQNAMYDATTAEIVDDFSNEGKSGLIFTYGVTNAGKSHTVLGSKEDPGLLPRAVERICARLNFDEQDQLLVSYMEIYNEQIFDLLVPPRSTSFSDAPKNVQASSSMLPPPARKNLAIRDRGGKVLVENLKKVSVTSAEEAMTWIEAGAKHRQTCNNNLNTDSSRSHSVCTLELVRAADVANSAFSSSSSSLTEHGTGGASLRDSRNSFDALAADVPTASLWLVDLAGSERGERTGVGGQSKKQAEANAINTSLFTLMTCLSSLRDNKPVSAGRFRESKLTRLLGAHLSGNVAGPGGAGRTCMIVNANPSEADFVETCHVMSQAAPCTKIKTKEGQPHSLSRQGLLLAAAQRFDANGRRIVRGAAGVVMAATGAKGANKKRGAALLAASASPPPAERRARVASDGLSNISEGDSSLNSSRSSQSSSLNSSAVSSASASASSADMAALQRENAELRVELEHARNAADAVEMEVREECAEEMASLMEQFKSSNSSSVTENNHPTNAISSAMASISETAVASSSVSSCSDDEATAAAAAASTTAGGNNGGFLASARKRKQKEDLERLVDDLTERIDDLEDELGEARNANSMLQEQLLAAVENQSRSEEGIDANTGGGLSTHKEEEGSDCENENIAVFLAVAAAAATEERAPAQQQQATTTAESEEAATSAAVKVTAVVDQKSAETVPPVDTENDGVGADSNNLAQEQEGDEDVENNEADDIVDAVLFVPVPLATFDPNVQQSAANKTSKYSPGVVGRTQMRIREKANQKKSKPPSGSGGADNAANRAKKMKGGAFSPRKTRSSTIPNPVQNM